MFATCGLFKETPSKDVIIESKSSWDNVYKLLHSLIIFFSHLCFVIYIRGMNPLVSPPFRTSDKVYQNLSNNLYM